jgi:uncharacterized protein with NRDE domain
VCLLIAFSRVVPGWPLIVAANRDERLDRPAEPLTVLRANGPRTAGGRDLMAGGTWLAVNDHGVVAGLTNKPATEGRDPTKRSRGEIPLALTAASSAEESVSIFRDTASPSDYNPCWALVGDRSSLYYLDITQAAGVGTVELPPGIHILENNSLEEASSKTDHVKHLLGDVRKLRVDQVQARLRRVVTDHTINRAPADDSDRAQLASRASACCVHTEEYGTRTSMLIRLSSSPAKPPEIWTSDGPPCTNRLLKASLFENQPSESQAG